MHKDKRGFAPITLILIIVAAVVVLGGVFYVLHKTATPASSVAPLYPVATTSTIITSTSTKPVHGVPNPTPTTPIASSNNSASLSPTSGPVGTVVTVYGSGFAATGNTVTMNGMVGSSMKDISSADGKTLTFTVPGSLGPNCQPDQACPQYLMVVKAGVYSVDVISNGVTYTIGSFTITGNGGLQTTL